MSQVDNVLAEQNVRMKQNVYLACRHAYLAPGRLGAVNRMANPILNPKLHAQVVGIALAAVAVLGIILSLIGAGGHFGFFCDDAIACDGAEAAEGSFLGFDWGHNLVHVLLAAIALVVGYTAYSRMARTYAQVFGIVYAALGVFGFVFADLFILHLELGENLLHLLIGAWGIAAGFFGTTATGTTTGAKTA